MAELYISLAQPRSLAIISVQDARADGRLAQLVAVDVDVERLGVQ